MNDEKKSAYGEDNFWDLDKFVPKRPQSAYVTKRNSEKSTSAVEIHSTVKSSNSYNFSDVSLSHDKDQITRFIPPRNDSAFAKKYTLFEYSPKNPFIKNVKVYSEKPDEKLFVETNLFIRERRALLDRTARECPHTAYYSHSPRYSQMSRGQLNWYLWWRENTRNGVFLETDESYIILYAYELVATDESEDKQKSLDMLCSLLGNYGQKDLNVVFRMMIRDMICDFCLLHQLPSPIEKLRGLDRQLLSSSFLPEFFIDFSGENRDRIASLGLSSLSMYDYKRSKFYTPENATTFKNAISGALAAVVSDEKAFSAIISFTTGMYGSITCERRPFARMINIVNRSIKFEITYFQMSNLKAAVTDAVRYSENKLREHLGSKTKLNVMSVNPFVKEAIDRFFATHYPPMPIVDRRRRSAAEKETEPHEYDKLYDVPKLAFSAEHAMEIERDSWETTKILTEAFASDDTELGTADTTESVSTIAIKPITKHEIEETSSTTVESDENDGLYSKISKIIGKEAEFIKLCQSCTATEQRKFAHTHNVSPDELADRINEAAVDVFGDILLENDGEAYRIIDDYIDQL
ncbi:MAG: TerB N-terminal domain-containing protein [Clostridia bacterium]|nr:TerB N-terminal domain-containing protein [Clostridia bacterium]